MRMYLNESFMLSGRWMTWWPKARMNLAQYVWSPVKTQICVENNNIHWLARESEITRTVFDKWSTLSTTPLSGAFTMLCRLHICECSPEYHFPRLWQCCCNGEFAPHKNIHLDVWALGGGCHLAGQISM